MKLVRYVGTDGCKDEGYIASLSAAGTCVVDTIPPRANATIRFWLNNQHLQVRMEPIVRDLADLAVCIYLGDEVECRHEAEDTWTRTIELVFPVRDLVTWKAAHRPLIQTLDFLSGDRFSVTWLPATRIPRYGGHRVSVPCGFDTVCLFSGGVDSLIGAYKLLSGGSKILLVGHYADGVTSAAQAELFEFLRQKFADSVGLIQCRVARAQGSDPRYVLPEKVEESHRVRSFLFLALAIAVARAGRIEHIEMPENGLIALNAPLGISRVGTLSTRTAHPRFLLSLTAVARTLGAFTGRLRNPFLYSSKTDIVRDAPADLYPALRNSVSCAHAGRIRWTGRPGIRHCGYCIPCIYRRAAFMEVGLDRSADYYRDVFGKLREMSEAEKADMRFLVRFSKRIIPMSEAQCQGMVVSQGGFPHNVGRHIGPSGASDYTRWSAMMRRWSSDFLTKVRQKSSGETRRILGL